MKNFRKLLYLLQLVEYQPGYYDTWLKKHPIDQLEEKKNKLKWTTRAFLTLIISSPLSSFLGKEKAVGLTNQLLAPIFKLAEVVLSFLAAIKLSFYPQLTKIVITGSYGKTTLKEMLAWVLKEKYLVLSPPGTVNHRVGIARLVFFALRRKHQVLIIEAAAYKPGEIKAICRMIKPEYGVITSIGWMHLERFKTIKNIKKTKREIEPFIKDKQKLITPTELHQMIDFEKVCLQIGKQLNLSPKLIKHRLKTFKPPERRMTIKKINPQVTLIDDSYNSNPLGFNRALGKLSKYKGHQKIVITRGIVELGPKQYSINKQIAKEAKKVVDILVVIGQVNQKALKEGFGSKNCLTLDNDENIDQKLAPLLRPPTVILLESQLGDHYF